MPEPADVPRPPAVDDRRSALVDRLHALRADTRVIAAVLSCVAVAAGVAWFRSGIAPASPATGAHARTMTSASFAPTSTTYVGATTSTVAAGVVVDVVGAVRSPGVVDLPATARVLDAIRAAGGAAPGADLARLNLAARLVDGARVAVPLVGQPPPALDPAAVTGAPDPAGTGTDPGDGGGDVPAAPVNVNTASAAELEALPGIGPSLAAAIVQERERNGPFRSVDDLNRVPGIGPGRLDRLRAAATV